MLEVCSTSCCAKLSSFFCSRVSGLVSVKSLELDRRLRIWAEDWVTEVIFDRLTLSVPSSRENRLLPWVGPWLFSPSDSLWSPEVGFLGICRSTERYLVIA